MKKFVLIFFLFQQLLQAQDLKINKQYITAPDLINPAFTGNELCLTANLMATFQWLGMDNAPRTYLLNAHKGFNPNQYQNYSKHGLGATVYNDRNGPYSLTGVRAAYAFHAYLHKAQQIRLSLGLSVTGTRYSLDQSMLFRNAAVVPDNPALNYAGNSSIVPNMALGLVLSVQKAYVGLSALNILPINPSYERVSVGKRNYYCIAGYKAVLTQSDVQLEPILMLNLSSISVQVADFSLLAIIKQSFGVGLTYRQSLVSIPGSPNSLAARFSLIQSHWTYTYTYDYGFNSLQSNSFGSHELGIGYKMCPNKIKKCPAY